MLTARIRTIIVAATATLGIVSALPSVSQAKAHRAHHAHRSSAAATNSKKVVSSGTTTTSAKSIARTVTTSGGKFVLPTTTTTSEKPVEAGSTGDGPADDRECQGFAATENFLLEEAQEELNTNGNGSDFNMLVDDAKSYQDLAEDEGCFIVNPM